MIPLQSAPRTRWQAFVSLDWFDALLGFLFKVTAKSSEVLLAAGIILSTANHFQQGSLFTTTMIEHGQQIQAVTPLFEIWTWTQAIGFEASAGVVLASALHAQQQQDRIKRDVLFALMAGLAFVGTVMLVMAFIEAATGIREQDLPTAYNLAMAILRGVVSVAYVTIGRVKNRRFSGSEEDVQAPPSNLAVYVTEIHDQLQQLAERMHPHMPRDETAIVLRLPPIQAASDRRAAIHHFVALMQQATSGPCDDPPIRQIRTPDPRAWPQHQHPRSGEIRSHDDPQVDGIVLLAPHDRHMAMATIQANHTRRSSPARPTTNATSGRPPAEERGEQPSGATDSDRSVTEDGRTPTTFEKGVFVRSCLAEDPAMRNAEIQRRANERGAHISAGYLSDLRKAFFAEQGNRNESD